jgi:hypothetical protein
VSIFLSQDHFDAESLYPRCSYAGIYGIKNLNRKFVGYIDLHQRTSRCSSHDDDRDSVPRFEVALSIVDFALAHAESGDSRGD